MKSELSRFLARQFLGNSLGDYSQALGMLVGILAALLLSRRALFSRLRAWVLKSAPEFEGFLLDVVGRVRLPEYLIIALYAATRPLRLAAGLDKLLYIALVLALSYRALTVLDSLIGYGTKKLIRGPGPGELALSAAQKNIQLVLKLALWSGALIFVLDNLGVNISTAVAGLGIGGVAVAMAAQQILGDLFSSFVIYMDEPFRVGDFIHVGDLMGTVEHVGIKTTRLRSLSGELLVFSNSDLTSSRIRNYKRMAERRVLFSFGVLYETPHAKLRAIPGVVREIIAAQPRTRLDRAHLRSFGDSSLDFEVVYYVLSPDYNVYMDIQQAINLALMERLQKEGVGFAYPTRTLYVNGRAPLEKSVVS